MMRAMCGVHHKDRKRAKDMMLMLGLNETTSYSKQCSLAWSCDEER